MLVSNVREPRGWGVSGRGAPRVISWYPKFQADTISLKDPRGDLGANLDSFTVQLGAVP